MIPVHQFHLHVLTFVSRVLDRPLSFSEPAANTIRGALGFALQRLSPDLYTKIFAPAANGSRPSGFASLPRPFVLRSRHLDGLTINPGEQFTLRLHLFLPSVIDELTAAVKGMSETGLGPQRSRCELVTVDRRALTLTLEPPAADPVTQIRIAFLTPTELKHEETLAEQPEFFILMRRVRDRIYHLQQLYGSGLLPGDFRALEDKARLVHLSSLHLTHRELSRISSRTGQRHPLSGFTGEATYTGSLAEFLPYLRIAEWTGVGRQTVWGKGEIELHPA